MENYRYDQGVPPKALLDLAPLSIIEFELPQPKSNHKLQSPNLSLDPLFKLGMGALLKLVDAILFIFFLLIAVAAPLIDAQTCLPLRFFPQILIDIKQWYTRQYGDYLVSEKPLFFVGLVTLELVFQWPLAILNIFGILTSKSWLNTTCLMYGASVVTSMVAVLAELFGSGKASDELLMIYFPFMGLGVLAILRGLLANPAKTTTLHIGKRPALGRKKKA